MRWLPLALPLVAFLGGKGTVVLLVLVFLKMGVPVLLRREDRLCLWSLISNTSHPFFWYSLLLLWSALTLVLKGQDGVGPLIRIVCLTIMGMTSFVGVTKYAYKFQKLFTRSVLLFLVLLLVYRLGIECVGREWWQYRGAVYSIRMMVIASVLVWPYVYLRYGLWNKKAWLWLGSITFFSYFMLPDTVFVGLCAALLSMLFPLRIQKLCLYIWGILFIGLPIIGKLILSSDMYVWHYMPHMKFSFQHRIFIWDDLLEKALQDMFFGIGFDGGTHIKGESTLCLYENINRTLPFEVPFVLSEVRGNIGRFCAEGYHVIRSHPHNVFVQIYLELGLLGLWLFFMWWRSLLAAISCCGNKYAFGCLIIVLAILSLSFNIWQNWLHALLWLVLLGFKTREQSCS